MDKPIPEAVVKLLHAANVYLYQIDFGDEGKADYVRAEDISRLLTAAQQQGQAVACHPDRTAIRLLVAAGFVTEDKANEALRIAHGFTTGPLAPPSAPVGVEAAARRLLEAYDGNAHPFEAAAAAQAMRDALAQKPAAVDGAMVERMVEAFLASTGQQHSVTQLQRDLTTEGMKAALATQHQEPTT